MDNLPGYWHWVAVATLIVWALIFRMRVTWRHHVAAFLAIAWAGTLLSWSIQMDPGFGGVTGRVINAETDKPIARARVYYPGGDSWVRTDADGRFRMGNVPVFRNARITVRARGYETSYDELDIQEGQVVEDVLFRMTPRVPTFSIYSTERVFTPDEQAVTHLNGTLVDRVNVAIYAADAVKDRVAVQSLTERTALVDRLAKGQPVLTDEFVSEQDQDGDFSGSLKLAKLPPGLYVLRATVEGGSLKRDSWFLVTDLAVVSRRSPSETLFFAQKFGGRPQPGVKLQVFADGRQIQTLTTGKDGTVAWRGSATRAMDVLATHDGQHAYLRLDELYSGDASSRTKLYLFTERPIYRPGHEVFFAGVVRRDDNRSYSVPSGRVHVRVQDVRGNPLLDRDFDLDAFGGFNGRVQLPAEAALGDAWIDATCEGAEQRAWFQVAEYRKPEFQVALHSEKPRYDSGEKVRIKVDARYFFGAPVNGAKVTYTVFESWYNFDSVQFQDLEGEGRPEEYGGMVAEGTRKTDEEGNAWIEFVPRAADHDRSFWVEAVVEDASHRKVTTNLDVLVTMGNFYLDAETDAYGYQPGDPVKLTVQALDYEQKPRADVPVSGRLIHEEWKEVTDDRGVSRYERRETELWKGKATTDPKGYATFDLQPPEEGSYKVELTAPDDYRTIHAKRWFFVAGGSSDLGYGGRDLTLMLDHDTYKPGEKARVMISTGAPDQHVLLCVDGRKILSHQVVHVKGQAATVTLPVPREYFPNVTVAATLVHDKQLFSDEKPLVVQSDDRSLNIGIETDRPFYEPGQTARIKVKITDAAGKPVVAQLSLGLVDVAIYSLAADRTQNIYDFFFGQEYSLVRTEYSFAPDYSGGRSKDEDPRIRRNFKDTAYWNAEVRTDAQGRAEITAVLPDNLTAWRATVRAFTKDTRVGQKTFDFTVKKPLLVRLEVPRFMAVRDQMEMAAVVHNETDGPQDVAAEIRVEGLTLQAGAEQSFTIPPGGSHRFAWMTTAPAIGTAKVTVLARGQGHSDAMELSFPILPHGVERVAASSGTANPSGSYAFDLAKDDSAQLVVYLSPSLASAAMQGLEYLADYPYGCVEQTMSRFLPDIVVARALKELGLPRPALLDKLPDMVEKGLQRLYDYQHGDGGWGWWKDDATNPYLTAYVVYGLHKARENGYQVSGEVYDRGVSALERLLKDNVGEFQEASGEVRQRTLWNARAYMIYVLTRIGHGPAKATLEAEKHVDAMNAYTRALLAESLWRQGQHDRARALLAKVMKDGDETATTLHWDTKVLDYSWVENPVEATTAVLRAMLVIDPQNPKAEKVVRWLVDYRKGPSWTSTKDTAAVIDVMVDYLMARRDELSPRYTAKVTVNGKPAATVAVDGPSLGERGVVRVPASLLQAGSNEVEVEREGSGALYWSAMLTTVPGVEDVPAASEGFKIERSYSLVTTTPGKDGKPEIKETPIAPDTVIPLGARVRVRVKVTNDRPYAYVIIEDRLAAGFELTMAEADRNTGGYWWVGREVHDDSVSIFATRLEPGAHEMTYDVWAEVPGDYHVRPAVTYLMYTPDVRGNSTEARLKVGGE